MLAMKVKEDSFADAKKNSRAKCTSLQTLALLAENTKLVMEKEVSDTSESSLDSLMSAPPLPPELVSWLT
ncbi:uncharacterized protein MONOS_17785 [Monocercomonoides exilis]|uniref:uncharacterized protein n=1 Tax=Monocercomonoides exilis TaxID=2049356 RepID=UPI003559CD27|nr:hypothetical protein MONOS_17785 [Monocercomonoides exilis]